MGDRATRRAPFVAKLQRAFTDRRKLGGRPVSSGVQSTGQLYRKKGKGSPYSITERRVPELISVLGSQPAGDLSHKPGGWLPLVSARPAVIPATLKRAASNFAAWLTEARWV